MIRSGAHLDFRYEARSREIHLFQMCQKASLHLTFASHHLPPTLTKRSRLVKPFFYDFVYLRKRQFSNLFFCFLENLPEKSGKVIVIDLEHFLTPLIHSTILVLHVNAKTCSLFSGYFGWNHLLHAARWAQVFLQSNSEPGFGLTSCSFCFLNQNWIVPISTSQNFESSNEP